jgi:anti-anti-sigma factor
MEMVKISAGALLDIYSVDQLAEAFLVALDRPGDLEVDLQDADSLHTAALQVLLGAKRQCVAEKRRLVFAGLSASLKRQLGIAGADRMLLLESPSNEAEQ